MQFKVIIYVNEKFGRSKSVRVNKSMRQCESSRETLSECKKEGKHCSMQNTYGRKQASQGKRACAHDRAHKSPCKTEGAKVKELERK